jgi:peptidoglycan/LPS O-acetylase OafA/YrhL
MKRIPTLDGWRAVAITAVVIHHLARWFYQQESASNLSVTRFGAFGVDVFLSYYAIEKPLLHVGRKLASRSLSQSKDSGGGLKQSALAALE